MKEGDSEMKKYEVIIPFEPIVFEALSEKSITKLAKSFILDGVKIIENKKGNFYMAYIKVQANKSSQAELIAVYRIEEFLRLFAVKNDLFRIMYSGVKSKKMENEDQGQTFEVIKNGEKSFHAQVKEKVETKEHISIEKRKNNFKFEERSLKWRDNWYDWLKLALELNYLAVNSQNHVPSLVLRYSALETITNNILGGQESLLKYKFKERGKKKDKFLKTVEKIFRKFGLENESGRLINRILETHAEGKNNRIEKALKKLNIDVQTKDIIFISKMRGKVIHPLKHSDHNDLKKANFLIEEWIKKSLQFLLSNPSNKMK